MPRHIVVVSIVKSLRQQQYIAAPQTHTRRRPLRLYFVGEEGRPLSTVYSCLRPIVRRRRPNLEKLYFGLLQFSCCLEFSLATVSVCPCGVWWLCCVFGLYSRDLSVFYAFWYCVRNPFKGLRAYAILIQNYSRRQGKLAPLSRRSAHRQLMTSTLIEMG